MANCHGLIAGAIGTGKTITMQGLVERFSELGLRVFLADSKDYFCCYSVWKTASESN